MDKTILLIAILAVVLLVIIYLLLHSHFKKQIAGFLLDLVVDAENTYGCGTGAVKKSYVSGMIYSQLPAIAKLVLSQAVIERLIDAGAKALEEYLKTLSATDQVKLIVKK